MTRDSYQNSVVVGGDVGGSITNTNNSAKIGSDESAVLDRLRQQLSEMAISDQDRIDCDGAVTAIEAGLADEPRHRKSISNAIDVLKEVASGASAVDDLCRIIGHAV